MNSRLNTKCLRNFHFFVLFPFKIISLKSSKGNFQHKISLTSESRIELNWWLNNLDFHNRIITTEADQTIYTDDSNLDCGAHD